MPGLVVVATDGFDLGRLAVLEAGKVARRTGKSVVVVFTRSYGQFGLSIDSDLDPMGMVEQTLDIQQDLAEAQCVCVLDPLGVQWEFEVRLGRPAVQLLSLAESRDAEMIIVPGRHQGRLGRLICPSLAAQVARHWRRELVTVYPIHEASDLRVGRGTARLSEG